MLDVSRGYALCVIMFQPWIASFLPCGRARSQETLTGQKSGGISPNWPNPLMRGHQTCNARCGLWRRVAYCKADSRRFPIPANLLRIDSDRSSAGECYREHSIKERLCARMSALSSGGTLRVVFSDA